jgi:hypothetical protein
MMTELERLRHEVSGLREKLARKEDALRRAENASWIQFQQERVKFAEEYERQRCWSGAALRSALAAIGETKPCL